MDFNEVKELIKIITGSALTEFELKLDNAEIKMSKNADSREMKQTVTAVSETVEIKEEKADGESVGGTIIRSPIVGTYYESANPQSPPFVKVGGKVKTGDVLCIIEAMKVMNEITAKEGGEIAEIWVTNEQMVEYNQPLFRII